MTRFVLALLIALMALGVPTAHADTTYSNNHASPYLSGYFVYNGSNNVRNPGFAATAVTCRFTVSALSYSGSITNNEVISHWCALGGIYTPTGGTPNSMFQAGVNQCVGAGCTGYPAFVVQAPKCVSLSEPNCPTDPDTGTTTPNTIYMQGVKTALNVQNGDTVQLTVHGYGDATPGQVTFCNVTRPVQGTNQCVIYDFHYTGTASEQDSADWMTEDVNCNGSRGGSYPCQPKVVWADPFAQSMYITAPGGAINPVTNYHLDRFQMQAPGTTCFRTSPSSLDAFVYGYHDPSIAC